MLTRLARPTKLTSWDLESHKKRKRARLIAIYSPIEDCGTGTLNVTMSLAVIGIVGGIFCLIRGLTGIR